MLSGWRRGRVGINRVNMVSRLTLSSLAFCVFLVAGVEVLCRTGVFRCRIAADVTLSEAAIPVLVVVGGLLIVGLGVAFLSEGLVVLTKSTSPVRRLLWLAVGGGLAGVVP